MKKILVLCLPAVLSLPLHSAYAQGDSPGEVCREAARLYEENDLEGALEEARWCLESLEQIKQEAAANLFPDEVIGFKGGELSNQSAMGMRIMEREYMRGNDAISVTFTAGGAAASGFAALAQMGMGMGGSGKKLRIQRRTVIDMSDGQNAEFSVSMKSGGMLNVASSSVAHAEVIEFMKAFPIAELDEAAGQ